MKSAYELAMERLKSKDPSGRKELTEEQKIEIAEVDKKFTAKAAERQIFLHKQVAEAEMSGNYEEMEALRKQLRSELAVIEEEKEETKEKIRTPIGGDHWQNALNSHLLAWLKGVEIVGLLKYLPPWLF